MTELERRKERKEKMMNFRRKRIEIAKSIMMYCENYIMAEEQLLTETDIEKRKNLYKIKNTAKFSLLIRFEQFKKKFEE